MTPKQIKHMVDRFLQWRLPDDFNPDAGINYSRLHYVSGVDAMPIGTNLLNAAQADEMVRFMLEEMPSFDAVCPHFITPQGQKKCIQCASK